MTEVSRRELLQAGGAAALSLALGLGGAPGRAGASAGPGRPFNILFLLTDQERYFVSESSVYRIL